MSGISKAWHRYWQRDLEDISNMATPEDAMTREQALRDKIAEYSHIVLGQREEIAYLTETLTAERQRREKAEAEIIRLRGMFVL